MAAIRERDLKKRLFIAAAILGSGFAASAQRLDNLDLQSHGYVTQAVMYSNQNSWNTTGSEHGSASWTETVANLSAQPRSKLRLGVQGRFFLLGGFGNSISLDWAQADYKFNDRIGIRAGKVKTPIGLYNETQDVDPAHLWVMLPQGIYPITSRNATLAHYGGVAYGTVPLGEAFGKVEYRAFLGERFLARNDGYLEPYKAAGITVPNGLKGQTVGGSLHWLTPVRGLMVGASESAGGFSGAIDSGPYSGTSNASGLRQTSYFGKLERGRLMVAGEYLRIHLVGTAQLGPFPPNVARVDQRPWYMMASYKMSGKLSAGAYYSSFIDRQAAFTSYRYQKDWTASALYAKAEQHWFDGAGVGFSASDNPNLVPRSRLSLLKLGVTF
jgi:hypothetical protein